MAQHQQRVIRAYSLPVELFDHLKANQRHLQRQADADAGTPATEGDPHWVTGSHALADIVSNHYRFGYVAGQHDMIVDDFITALYMGDLKAVKVASPDANRTSAAATLPLDVREHLSAYRASRDLASDADALVEIIQTNMLLAEMGKREGRSMNTIAEATRTANEWHREGFRGQALKVAESVPVAH